MGEQTVQQVYSWKKVIHLLGVSLNNQPQGTMVQMEALLICDA